MNQKSGDKFIGSLSTFSAGQNCEEFSQNANVLPINPYPANVEKMVS